MIAAEPRNELGMSATAGSPVIPNHHQWDLGTHSGEAPTPSGVCSVIAGSVIVEYGRHCRVRATRDTVSLHPLKSCIMYYLGKHLTADERRTIVCQVEQYQLTETAYVSAMKLCVAIQ